MKFIWSSRAWRDLCAIGDQISKDNPSAARKHINKLVKKMRRIRRYPNSGRIVLEVANDAIREIVAGNYRVVYLFDKGAKTITVLTVFESHRQLRL